MCKTIELKKIDWFKPIELVFPYAVGQGARIGTISTEIEVDP